MRRSLAHFAAWWLGLSGLYLILAGKLSAEEISGALASAVISAAALTVMRVHGGIGFELKACWLPPLLRTWAKVVPDSWVVVAAICGRPFRRSGSGRLREVEFDPGGPHAVSRTRRALIIASLSLAPNSFVIGVLPKRGLLLMHDLVPARVAPDNVNWPL